MDSLYVVEKILIQKGYAIQMDEWAPMVYAVRKDHIAACNQIHTLFDIHSTGGSKIMFAWYPRAEGDPPRLRTGHSVFVDLADPDSLDMLDALIDGRIDYGDPSIVIDTSIDIGAFDV